MMKLIWDAQDFFQVSSGYSFYGLSRLFVAVCSVLVSSPGHKLLCIHFDILVLYE